jgi:hypothetical protein
MKENKSYNKISSNLHFKNNQTKVIINNPSNLTNK